MNMKIKTECDFEIPATRQRLMPRLCRNQSMETVECLIEGREMELCATHARIVKRQNKDLFLWPAS